MNRQGYLQGLVGGEYESQDRIFTGQISGFLNGNLDGASNTNIQYGFESSCPDGVDQNTALLATAAAIGRESSSFIHHSTTYNQHKMYNGLNIDNWILNQTLQQSYWFL